MRARYNNNNNCWSNCVRIIEKLNLMDSIHSLCTGRFSNGHLFVNHAVVLHFRLIEWLILILFYDSVLVICVIHKKCNLFFFKFFVVVQYVAIFFCKNRISGFCNSSIVEIKLHTLQPLSNTKISLFKRYMHQFLLTYFF